MTTFFTGCTHFEHANIINLAGRPFVDVDEMNEELIRRWNAVVGTRHLVYHLGDVSWGTVTPWMKRLNGQKFLIVGNHDKADALRQASGGIIGVEHYVRKSINGKAMVLMHYPIEDWDGRYKGSIHLHCHTHSPKLRNPRLPYVEQSALNGHVNDHSGGRPLKYPAEQLCNRFCVGVDSTSFAPISFEEIMEQSKK